ncbi:MAG: Fe-S cluster assembly protein HesB [Chitinophagaceae bacterium]
MSFTTDHKTDLLFEVHHLLIQVYGSNIKYFHDLDPLSELVPALLSYRTRNSDSSRAFKNLKAGFPSWEAVKDASTKEVEEQISPCTWSEQKAPRIQQVLRLITERCCELSLDFLADMSVYEARQWLEEMPGVGPKTSAAVLSFSTLRAKALPVDSHHFRVATRLGIISEKIDEAKAHKALEGMLPADFTSQEMYDHHQVMMRHGQKVCTYFKPDCLHCVLLDLCPTGKAILSKEGH